MASGDAFAKEGSIEAPLLTRWHRHRSCAREDDVTIRCSFSLLGGVGLLLLGRWVGRTLLLLARIMVFVGLLICCVLLGGMAGVVS